MEETYRFLEVEKRVRQLWEEGDHFSPNVVQGRKPYSMFLVPPNASGPMHVGNALMIAIQDILARYHRAKGTPILWVPGTDHGGYETQVTFERGLDEAGKVNHDAQSRKKQFSVIQEFVEKNNEKITDQVKAMGASVDWSRFRFTLDEPALAAVSRMFEKMISDNLVYRSPYMVNYCTSCATVLADIELKEVEEISPLYFVTFPFKNEEGYLPLATTRPEFLFEATYVLVHPQDTSFAHYIGKVLTNPVTGGDVHVIESKRKYDPKNPELYLSVFSPTFKSYDFQYALRNGLPKRPILNWEGALIERYPGLKPAEARVKELEFLAGKDCIERVDNSHTDLVHLCKKGHMVESIILSTWFVKLDDVTTPLRQPALDAIKKEALILHPRWREKGLVEWIQKMHDWPIARQNVWGIKIPIWYEVTDPALFTVWFVDSKGEKKTGNLKAFLDEEIALQEILDGLERIYADETVPWTLKKQEGKIYIPETDTFDTWFSSVFQHATSSDHSYFYPSDIVVIGYDILRLSIAREIVLGRYLADTLPFKRVYFHQLLKAEDGQKMSKSAGNSITLDEFLGTYGADVTRMALVSYTGLQEDFIFSNERLEFFKTFSERLWKMGQVANMANVYSLGAYKQASLSAEDKQLLSECILLGSTVNTSIEKYFLASAQEKAVGFLERLEAYASTLQQRNDTEHAVPVFYAVFRDYITLLHPFMPFMTEELYTEVYKPTRPLAGTVREPGKRGR